MGIKEVLKELWFQLTHDPYSSEGLRHRAERLIKNGADPENPYVTALIKMAKFEEEAK